MADSTEKVEALIAQALAAHNAGDFSRAISHYRAVLDLQGDAASDGLRHLEIMARFRGEGDIRAAIVELSGLALGSPGLTGLANNYQNVLSSAAKQIPRLLREHSPLEIQDICRALENVANSSQADDDIRAIAGNSLEFMRAVLRASDSINCEAENAISASVVIPVYNMDKYLYQCLESVGSSIRNYSRTSNGKKCEIIVVDDCSEDGSQATAHRWARTNQDIPVQIVRLRRNSGQARARNFGSRCADGQVVFFLDSDDYYHPDHITAMMGALDAHPDAGYAKSLMKLPADVPSDFRQKAIFTSPINLAVRKSCLEAVRGFPEGNIIRILCGEDAYVNMTLVKHFNGVKVMAETAISGSRPESHLTRLAAKAQDETPDVVQSEENQGRWKEMEMARSMIVEYHIDETKRRIGALADNDEIRRFIGTPPIEHTFTPRYGQA